MPSRTYKGISNRGRYLLGQQENDIVDFKESMAGLSSDDLIAFANTELGGAILIGVREGRDVDSLQTAEIVGVEDVGDAAKMTVLNKAASCLPPIEVEFYVENLSDRPFVRIEILPSTHRPHCTASGTYKIREDGRNRALHPRGLLTIFLEAEGDRFFNRFIGATSQLQDEIIALRRALRDRSDREEPPERPDGIDLDR